MYNLNYKIKYQSSECNARSATINTPHGIIETPIFMPVGTLASVKFLDDQDLDQINAQIILSNTYHLWLRPGDNIIKDIGGIHKFMNYHKPILTDSGGFQVFSLQDNRKIKEEGVYFKSHLDGQNLFLSPEKSIEIQNNIGADIIMSFDECIPFPSTYQYTKDSTDRTIRWAKRCKENHNRDDQALFGIVQGSNYSDLREYCAKELINIDFDGYAIGGTSVGEDKKTMYDMIDMSIKYLPKDKPRYLMGVGTVNDLLIGIEKGVDMFDCVLPTRIARHGTCMTSNGRINIKKKIYKNDYSPLDSKCNCKCCTKYTKAYLNHLYRCNEGLGSRLMSIHNLHFLIDLTTKAKQAIKEDNYLSFKEDILKTYNYDYRGF